MSCSSSAITNEQVLALLFSIAPQFQTEDPVKLASYNSLIDALRCMINEKYLGCCATIAFANLVAHYLSIQANPYTGISSSISEGQLSISLASSVGQGFYSSTPYGQAYWQMVSNFKIGAYVTNSRRVNFGPSCCGRFGPWI